MKLLLTLLLTIPTLAQTIQNSSFELPRDTNRLVPAHWRIAPKPGYSIQLDSTTAKTGRYSLRFAGDATNSGNVSQTCTVQMSQTALVHLRGFVKTDNPDGVAFWWNAYQDQKNRGFVNSQHQISLRKIDDWQAVDIVLPVVAQVNRFTFGAHMTGRGNTWIDDLRFESAPTSAAAPSTRVVDYMDRAIRLIQRHALMRDSIAWPQTRAQMMALAGGMQREEQTHPLIDFLLFTLNEYDNHSSFTNPTQAKTLATERGADWGIFSGELPTPKARYLGDGIGYIAVPWFWSLNTKAETAFATQLQGLIRQIDLGHPVTNWVVDLREDWGGNMWPMVAGLLPLYGKKAKDAYRQETKVAHPYQLRKLPHRVAILIGPQTNSSGEFTALSFIGLPGVRSFGLPTGGHTINNETYDLSDGARLVIASFVGKDRAGRKYLHGILPDEEIKARATAATDPTLTAATAWLLKK